MFYDHTNFTGGSTLPDDDPNSPIQQMIQVLDQLPDAGTV